LTRHLSSAYWGRLTAADNGWCAVGDELAEISYTVRWQTVNYAVLFLMTWT